MIELLAIDGAPVNRAHLLTGPRDHDDCDAFEQGTPGSGDCETDGHWLCCECRCMSEAALARREEEPPRSDQSSGAFESDGSIESTGSAMKGPSPSSTARS